MQHLTALICPYSTEFEMSFINFLSWVHSRKSTLAPMLGAIAIDEGQCIIGQPMHSQLAYVFPPFQPTIERALLVGSLKLDLEKAIEAIEEGGTTSVLGTQWVRLQTIKQDGQFSYSVVFDVGGSLEDGQPCAVYDLADLGVWIVSEAESI